ncbi:inositol-trisphosphate 3-kinase B-like isoform X2 [Uloborus diversus]|uniref:inositol-trisphosphate 3-kinase B-like isoform X2 n=1 Tax=Uloborus diversus TaxID=327109 RepID=UPI0024094502|nr:inositol-trisphosphate 3-kinase B-like isoform X2 [Uloborus diversus]
MAQTSYGGYAGSWLTVTPLNHAHDGCGTSSDDLSSDWEVEETRQVPKPSAWKRVRNLVRCTPFIQTYKKQKYPWVQLAGHQGNFRAGHHGTIFKKFNSTEVSCFEKLMKDVLRPYVPAFKGKIVQEDETYIELDDLLVNFENACVMDIKIGVRTYSEDELARAKGNPKLRKDMYEKMIQIDSNEPTEEEHRLKAITKPRYMVWRETISSTSSLGFRIEGIKKSDGTTSRDFKRTKTKEQVMAAILDFTDGFSSAIFIGSSLLFVHDKQNANIWLIDFAKTVPLPLHLHISHQDPWKVGNHEDGYLIGISNLLSIFKTLNEKAV